MTSWSVGSFPHVLTTLTIALVLSTFPRNAAAQAGLHSVRGRILDRLQGAAIAGATITLDGDRRATTDTNGQFEIRGVRPGSYSLRVEALGYRTVETTITLDGRSDAAGTIQLEPDPIRLDSLAVRPVTASVRGRVIERATGRRVPFITVRQGTTRATATSDAGTFHIALAHGEQTLTAEGFGWLPATIRFDANADTTVEIALDPDPIMVARIEAQVEVIAERSRSVGISLRVLGRADILDSSAPTPIEYLKGRGVAIRDCPGMTGKLCIGRGAVVYIDEIPSCLETLAMYPNEAFERIELIGRGGSTIRAFTRWFVERMTENRVVLQPITPFDKPFTC